MEKYRLTRRLAVITAVAATACLVATLSGCAKEPGARPAAGLASDLAKSAPIDASALERAFARQETLEGSLMRGSIDLGSSTITYYSKGAAGNADAPLAPEDGDMAVVDFSPTGELPVEMRRPTVYVMFRHPVVPLAKLGQPMRDSPIMSLEPAVPGTYRWYGTRVLSFEPDEPLVGNPRYRVTVSADTKSLGGRRLGKPFSFDFYTEPVKVVNFYPGDGVDTDGLKWDVPTAIAKNVILEFNQPVDPDHIASALSVRVGTAEATYKVSRPAYPESLATRTPRAVLISLVYEPPENMNIKITLKKGASPFKGYPETKEDQTLRYSTIRPLSYVELESYAYDMPRNNLPGALPVYARFSHPLAKGAEALPWVVEVDGKRREAASVELFGTTVRLNLQGLEPGDNVLVTSPAGVKDVYGRSLKSSSELTTIPEPRAYVGFPYRSFYHLEAAFPPKLLWEARNMDAIALGKAAGDAGDWVRKTGPRPAPVAIDMSAWKRNKVHYSLEELAPYLNAGGYGTVFFNWTSLLKTSRGDRKEDSGFAVQVTDIGVTTRYAHNKALVWARSLSSGKPIADATVTVAAKTARTDASGLAVIAFAPGEMAGYARANRDYSFELPVRVEKGADEAELFARNTHNLWTSTTYGYINPSFAEEPVDRAMIFTDRGLYKPGEELALRGIHWVQRLSEFTPYSGGYALTLNDPRDGRLLWEAKGEATASGGFAHRFKLPEGLEPGSYTIRYSAGGRFTSGVSFTIAQFRRLAFQVESSVADRPFYMGDEASVEVKASYLAGGAMPEAAYQYYWTRKPAGFVPPGTRWKGYVFGPGAWEGEKYLSSGKGVLSPAGAVVLKESTGGQNATGSAYHYVLETTVQDIDRQAIASAATVLVHPASFYVGVKFASGAADGWWSRFVSTGKDVKSEAALAAPDGEPWTADARLTARLTIGKWKSTEQQGVYGRVNTRWEYVEEEVEAAELEAKGGRASWTFRPKEAGDYILSYEGKDAAGRLTKTSLRFYATGSSWARNATETPSSIELVPDKAEYLPGETARVLVRSPLPDADYLVTVERQGILSERVTRISDGNAIIELPITDEHVPVIYLALSAATKREAAPSDYFEPDLGKPRSVFGIVGLKVSTKPVELDVEVASVDGAYKPGTTAEVLVRVTREGKPVAGGEVTLMAVDRGVLDLIDYHVPDPVAFFYDPGNFPLGVHGDDSRRLLLKPVSYDTSLLTGGDGEKPHERKDFRPLALFEPFVVTNDQGLAKVSFKLPDSLTTYRLTAVALSGSRLGLSEAELLVQNPVNVRAALPRRFRNRDTAAAGVILQNLTKTAQTVTVGAASDILRVEGEATRTVTIPPSGVYELPFVLAATTPGEGTISFTVKSDVVNEILTEKVIVERPLVKEAFSTVGSIARDAQGAEEGLSIPSAIAPGYGSLTVRASSSLRPYMEPSLDRLLERPEPWWGYYRRLLYSFAATYEGRSEQATSGLLSELAGRQLPGGGIYTGSWAWRPYLADDYVSLLTAHFQLFAESRKAKPSVGPDRAKLLSYLETLKADDKRFGPYFKAYLAYVLSASGRKDAAYLQKVEALEDELGLGGYGLLAQAYLAAGDRTGADRVYKRSKNFVLMGTQKLDVKESYEATQYWSSLLAEMAIMLKNAYELNEDPGFVQRLAGSLDRSERYWRTLNDDLWTMLGFIPLLDAEGPGAGAASFTLSSGQTALASAELSAAAPQATETLEFSAKPLADLPRDSVVPLSFAKQGDTPLYYATILRYALPNETAYARDEGIELNLRYETLGGDVVADDALVLGETYRVRANVSTTKRRQRLELLVPIPNGAEIVDPGFVTTGRFSDSGGAGSETITRETVYGDAMDVTAEGYASRYDDDWYWYFYRPDSFALDNMMVYRWTDFYAGTRELTFLVRVTTPGVYPTPPASASLEFEPEVFGRSEGRLFVIKP